MSARYHFSFKSNYRGDSDFEVYDRQTQESHRIRMTLATGATRYIGADIPADVLDALNEWRLSHYETEMDQIALKFGQQIADNIEPFRKSVAA